MIPTHRIFDDVLFAFLLVLPVVEWRVTWPRFLARLAAGVPGARLAFYQKVIFGEWLAVVCLLVFWNGRPWRWLLLGAFAPLPFGVGMGAAVVIAVFLRVQYRALAANPDLMARARRQLGGAVPLLPHTRAERKLFHVVSITAGVCEEILFRGFLYWYFSVWTGPVAAVILSSLVFGCGHFYLGRKEVPKTMLVGLFLAGVALASGSLWPAIVIHAAVDWNSGEIGFRMMNAPVGAEPENGPNL